LIAKYKLKTANAPSDARREWHETDAAQAAKNTFRGQMATKCDTGPLRRGNRPCEKGLAAATAGQKQAKNWRKRGKNGENGRFFKGSPGHSTEAPKLPGLPAWKTSVK
jgi:hypothetical protein